MINKTIHYCWFGGNPKSKEILKCIDSWKKYLKGYEIIEWNESNYDVNKSQYMRDAYNLKKWAFVSDYARFDILYNHGGIYLDVDVEFIKPLDEKMLDAKGLCGFENEGDIAPGLIFGVEKGNPIILDILNSYNDDHFEYNKNGIYKTVNTRLTEILSKYGFKNNNQRQCIEGIEIYPSDYFCAYDNSIKEPIITENTICWHHYLGTWQNSHLKTNIQKAVKKVIGINNYRNLLNMKRKFLKKH